MVGCWVKGKKYRGRPKLLYVRQIMKDQECDSYIETKSKASNREEWSIAANQYSV